MSNEKRCCKLSTQRKELENYMKQPSFMAQTPTRKDEAQKQLDLIKQKQKLK
ncbi:MAG: hypothetical protein K0Q57_581 [Gammaproteobacteria bacterium]|jgi:hypothetical protein|nr:hypothetical protein [Gammaproteobacteria bacterium]